MDVARKGQSGHSHRRGRIRPCAGAHHRKAAVETRIVRSHYKRGGIPKVFTYVETVFSEKDGRELLNELDRLSENDDQMGDVARTLLAQLIEAYGEPDWDGRSTDSAVQPTTERT